MFLCKLQTKQYALKIALIRRLPLIYCFFM